MKKEKCYLKLEFYFNFSNFYNKDKNINIEYSTKNVVITKEVLMKTN